MKMPLDLPQNQLTLIQTILQRHLPERKIIAFGSRTNGKALRFSDLDLCIMGNEKIESKSIWKLKDELEEAPLPIRVDVLDWATLSENFRKIIASQPQEIIQAGS